MKQKTISLLTVLFLLISLAFTVSAAGSAPFVTDDADLLSPDQEQILTETARQAAADYNFGIYLITVPDWQELTGDDDIEETARAVYLNEGYGIGGDSSGILLLQSTENRKYAIFHYGDNRHAFSGKGHKYLTGEFLDDLKDDRYFDAYQHFFAASIEMLDAAENGKPIGKNPPHFRAYGIAACVVLGFLTAGIVILVLKSQLTSVSEKSEASAFVAEDGLNLSQKRDIFTHRTQTRVYDPPESSSSDNDSTSGSSSGDY